MKENIPGVVKGFAFASAAQAKIARAETPASNIALDLIMRFPLVARRDCPASLTEGSFRVAWSRQSNHNPVRRCRETAQSAEGRARPATRR